MLEEWLNTTDVGNLDTWPTVQEVMTRLNLSEKTVYRRVADGTLQKLTRPIPGRKPLPILNPLGVKTLAETILTPIAVAVQDKAPPKALRSIPSEIQTALTTLTETSLWALKQKHYLTLKEASTLSGLPKSWLKERFRNGVIPSRKAFGQWRVRQDVLERYDLVTDTVLTAPRLKKIGEGLFTVEDYTPLKIESTEELRALVANLLQEPGKLERLTA